MKSKVCILCFMVLMGCQPSKNTPILQDLHDQWTFASSSDSLRFPAKVPGTIHSDLLANGLIKDPFVLTNEDAVQWVADSSWTYRSTFLAPKSVLSKKNITLNIDGLDTYARVYLNDSLISTHSNAFIKKSIPITSILQLKNTLRIEFQSTSIAEEEAKKKAPYSLPEGNRIFTRKAQFQYGWDWGPKLNTSGIWKRIYLKAWDDFLIDDVYVETQKITHEEATLRAEIYISSSLEKKAYLSIDIAGKQYEHELLLQKGKQKYTIPITIKNPKLWWPHTYGTPHLYTFNFSLKVGGSIVDEKTLKHGVRTVQLVTEKDSIGESFYFTINGVPIYAKGANYIPQNSFQTAVSVQDYQKIINSAVDAHMNMLRVWGGGIYENDVFYDLCDEKGILVWQDFMFACAMYPGDEQFLNSVQLEATQQVRRLRNHASIALWAGNNENAEGWRRWGWQIGRSEAEKNAIWADYLKVFDSILPKTVANLSNTSYWESSPKYGRGNPKYLTEGDAHDWWVWHDAYPFEHFQENVPRFMSEFGFQAYPSIQTLNYINQKDSLDLKTAAIKSHQKHIRGFELIDMYMKRDFPLPRNDQEYVYLSQLLQAKGITMGIEAQRRAKPYSMGSLYWQLNDCWPAISWSSIDYFGNWKALHYKAKEAFSNVLISPVLNNKTLYTYIVNDSLASLDGTLTLNIKDFKGRLLQSLSKDIRVINTSSQLYAEISLDTIDPQRSYAEISFGDIRRSFYFVKPKELVLPQETLKYEISKHPEGYLIQLKSTVIQKDVMLRSHTTGHFNDNFFDVYPHQEKTILFSTKDTIVPTITIQSLNQLAF